MASKLKKILFFTTKIITKTDVIYKHYI